MAKPEILRGEVFVDARGRISSLNDWRLDGVRRMYVITHDDCGTVRAWHGHRFERKWFFCAKGAFTLALVEIDDWENPSPSLRAAIFRLSEHESCLICVPAGYANGLKASEPSSVMTVFSDKTLDEAALDSWRYAKENWVDWELY